MIGRHRLVFLMFTGGVLLAFAGCAPSQPAAPATSAGPPAATKASAASEVVDTSQFAPKVYWSARSSNVSRSVVEVTWADPRDVKALGGPGMTRDLWTSFLAVRVVPEGGPPDAAVPPLLGTYRVADSVLRFEPRFPLEPGVLYRAEFDRVRLHEVAQALSAAASPAGAKPSAMTSARISADFSLPRRPMKPTATVTAVYPSRSTLPENLLRFYIHFSEPMSRGEAYHHIQLRDAAGKPVADAFLELAEELWSGDGKRFTLLFQPGRIKRGLRPREELGPILEAGKSYELVIDPGWTDADGRVLKAEFRKAFRAGPADMTSPDPKTWTIHPPQEKTRDPLEVRFPEPLDRGLLDRLIAVRDGSDKPVQGSVEVADEETTWRFLPAGLWQAGDYRLVVGTELEDVAGNSVARPFEVDEVRPITRKVEGQTVTIPFHTGPPSSQPSAPPKSRGERGSR